MAPEVAVGQPYHHTVDTYSYGIIVWQVLSGVVPFRDLGRRRYYEKVAFSLRLSCSGCVCGGGGEGCERVMGDGRGRGGWERERVMGEGDGERERGVWVGLPRAAAVCFFSAHSPLCCPPLRPLLPQVVHGHMRPPLDSSLPPRFRALLARCWHSDKNQVRLLSALCPFLSVSLFSLSLFLSVLSLSLSLSLSRSLPLSPRYPSPSLHVWSPPPPFTPSPPPLLPTQRPAFSEVVAILDDLVREREQQEAAGSLALLNTCSEQWKGLTRTVVRFRLLFLLLSTLLGVVSVASFDRGNVQAGVCLGVFASSGLYLFGVSTVRAFMRNDGARNDLCGQGGGGMGGGVVGLELGAASRRVRSSSGDRKRLLFGFGAREGGGGAGDSTRGSIHHVYGVNF